MAKLENMLDVDTIHRLKKTFGTTEGRDESPTLRQIHDLAEEGDGEIIKPSDLSDEELGEEIDARLSTICNIKMQLNEDQKAGFVKGDIWRIRAQGAIRHYETELWQLQGLQKIRLTL